MPLLPMRTRMEMAEFRTRNSWQFSESEHLSWQKNWQRLISRTSRDLIPRWLDWMPKFPVDDTIRLSRIV